MSDIAIKVENLSKAYQLGDYGTGTLTRDIERWWALMRGKDDPFLMVGETNDRTLKGGSDIVWSLKDINFEIKEGDAVGIIGRNGAGKSTLLKVLSRVTSPSTGNIKVKGRIASLLEVGTGFHPELTGGENIYLNGAIMGMTKREIKKKFDEIVDFAGVERYVDTPVKRYSSGMYVRLAFAVAAHLESEILIVDEVLAVGDAEFQKKCLGKMGDVSKGEGRTVLFVSHNMGSISLLCNRGIYMKNGLIAHLGNINETLDAYINSSNNESSYKSDLEKEESYIDTIYFVKDNVRNDGIYLSNQPINVHVVLNCKKVIKNLTMSIIVKDQTENPIFSSHYLIPETVDVNQQLSLNIQIPENILLPANYKLEPVLHVPNKRFVDKIDNYLSFSIEDKGSDYSIYVNDNLGKVIVPVKWENFK